MSKMKTVTMVDPPSGHRYGFPKELKDGVSYKELLEKSGYPEKDIEFAMQYSRFWMEEVEDKSDNQSQQN